MPTVTSGYEPLIASRPSALLASFFDDGCRRRFVHQVWDWLDERRYIVHAYISRETGRGSETLYFSGRYRAITVEETVALADKAGFTDNRPLSSIDVGFYQQIIMARRL